MNNTLNCSKIGRWLELFKVSQLHNSYKRNATAHIKCYRGPTVFSVESVKFAPVPLAQTSE